MNKSHHGFTLIELMIALSVVAILITVAVPKFSSMLQSNRLATQTNLLIADLNFARSESVKRNTSINLSPAAEGWGSGWTILVASDNELLRNTEISQQNIAIAPNSDTDLIFTNSGNLNSQTSCFTVSDSNDKGQHRTIKIEATGRVALTTEECT